MRPEEVPEPFQGSRLYDGMFSSFCLAKTVYVVRGTLRIANDARKTLLAAEAEMFVCDDAAQSEEALDAGENTGRIGDESFATDEVQPIGVELCQPAAYVDGVQSDLDRSPGRVHRRRRRRRRRCVGAAAGRVDERQLVECRHHCSSSSSSLGAGLGVVGQGTRHWISQHDDQSHVARHLPHSFRNISRY